MALSVNYRVSAKVCRYVLQNLPKNRNLTAIHFVSRMRWQIHRMLTGTIPKKKNFHWCGGIRFIFNYTAGHLNSSFVFTEGQFVGGGGGGEMNGG